MYKLVLIDSDSLCYQSSKETLVESIDILDEKVQNIFTQTEATHYAMFISQGRYFRHNIDPGYKSNRGKYKTPLKWLKTLKSYLQEKYGAISMNMVEADDLIAYYHNTWLYSYKHKDGVWKLGLNDPYVIQTPNELTYMGQEVINNVSLWDKVEIIVASADKDVLKSIVGRNFNYSYNLPDKMNSSSLIKGWWEETTGIAADEFLTYQMIAGDTSDNIITPFPENCAIHNQSLKLHEVLVGYIDGLSYTTPSGQKKFKEGLGVAKGIYEFQKNYRLLHLLNCDEDFMREVGTLPPNIVSIIQEIPKETHVW